MSAEPGWTLSMDIPRMISAVGMVPIAKERKRKGNEHEH
jgi:hypothetical protein